MAYYSTFIFQLPGCPEIHLSTRYDIIQIFWERMKETKSGGQYYKPPSRMHDGRSLLRLNKFQRRKIQTFMKMVHRKGNERIPRKWRKFVINNGVLSPEILDWLESGR